MNIISVWLLLLSQQMVLLVESKFNWNYQTEDTEFIAKVSLVGRALALVLFTAAPGGWGWVCTSQHRFCTT